MSTNNTNHQINQLPMSFFGQVYELVRQIPRGKVVTYGQIARVLGTRDARKVGWAVHGNSDRDVPCHRVVNKDGGLAPNFAFDGWREQRRRLMSEGVKFVDETHVDLERHLAQVTGVEVAKDKFWC